MNEAGFTGNSRTDQKPGLPLNCIMAHLQHLINHGTYARFRIKPQTSIDSNARISVRQHK
jgi:hypothetical protein